MPSSFDDVLPAMLRIVATGPLPALVNRLCVVRDLLGRVRLAIDPKPGVSVPDEAAATESALQTELGGYFRGPILHPQSPRLRHFVVELFKHAKPWPTVWPSSYALDPIAAPTLEIDRTQWYAFERALSKQSWLYEHRYEPPWPLQPRAPTIVAFYSFKGGVGRTTLLATMAWRLARAGRKVVVVDLDLEAPGVSTLLGVDPQRGVVDYVVDHVATGRADGRGWPAARTLAAEDASKITVVPAGRLDWHYLEKLARLDFAGARTGPPDESPTLGALRTLVKTISSESRPDYILIDSRAGLHDIGGLSLHALSHIDVLVTRAGEQGYRGLALILQALRQHKQPEDLQCIMVHSMAPGANMGDLRERESYDFLDKVYELFLQHVYTGDDVPDRDDATASHHPWVVSFDPRLERIDRLDSALESAVFSSIELGGICERIQELAGEATDDDDPAGGSAP
jgi:MinD-like ATPase involved in chromosome partitioning or flagellar assembly